MENLTILKMLRQASGMTLDHIHETGVSKWTYMLIEKGTYKTTPKSRKKITEIFNLKSKYIFSPKGFAIIVTVQQVQEFAKQLHKQGETKDVDNKDEGRRKPICRKSIKRTIRKGINSSLS